MRRIISRRYVLAASVLIITFTWIFCLPSGMFDGVPYSTVVVGSHGELLGARVADDGQWRFPPCDSVPYKFAAAIIEYEDRSFYSHRGVSLRGIGRALVQNVSNRRIVSGGSTITMQVIRMHRRRPRGFIEKAIEMFMATRLEMKYSKEEILKMYVSHAPFGGNVVGLDAAMWRYFGRDSYDMSWAEAATLAVLQNAPSSIHLSRNRDKLEIKRNRLLRRLCEKGIISDDEYSLSLEEPLPGSPCPLPQICRHLTDYYDLTRHGKRTVTGIDMMLQPRLDELMTRYRNNFEMQGAADLAAVVIDVQSGDIVAYCGNAPGEVEREGMWVDIARSPRSSGSILKPLLYCAALQDGVILPETILPDVPSDFGGFAPQNFDGRYSGAVKADNALSLSLNIPNVYLLKEYGVSRFAALLRSVGLSTITRRPDEYGLSIILGGAEVTLVDIVRCYAAVARIDSGQPLTDKVAVRCMFEAMSEVGRPDMIDLSRVSSLQKIAWKTGTSWGARDGWAIGVTPQYAVGVWVGNADGSGVPGLTGAKFAGPVMFDIFDMLPSSGWFDNPGTESGTDIQVCTASGYKAGEFCADKTMMRVPSNGIRTGMCPYCSKSGETSCFALPPVMQHYYRLQHPDHISDTAYQTTSVNPISFIYPADGAVLFISRDTDSDNTGFVCKVTHAVTGTELFWHIDNVYLGSTRDIHQMTIIPDTGYHKITVVDADGHSKTVEFIVK